jgi:hypothetical protein
MNKIIDYDPSYEFSLIEDPALKLMHPVSKYYTKLNDLSINLLISLKWIRWGYYFFTSLSKELKNLEKKNYSWLELISKSIQKESIKNLTESEHELIIDDQPIKSDKDFELLIKNSYSLDIFDENTKIHLKLKINLREYIIITNILFPTLIQWNS